MTSDQNPTVKLEPVVKQRLDNIQMRLKQQTMGRIEFSEIIRRLILSVWHDKTRNEMRRIVLPEDLVFIEDTNVMGIGLFDKDGIIEG